MVKTYLLSDGDEMLSEHFALHEMASQDGTDEVLVSDRLMERLEILYSKLNASSIIVTSGYRTPGFSVKVGGSMSDAHTKGFAADIIVYRDGEVVDGKEVCCVAQDCGFGGIGYMGNAVHVDVRDVEDYYNNHWWGDEIAECNVDDFYLYFGMASEPEAAPVEEQAEAVEEVRDETNGGDYVVDTDKPDVNVLYSVRADGRILPEVSNLEDYAGINNTPITGVCIYTDDIELMYQVHVKDSNQWLPECSSLMADWTNDETGYAGNGEMIDALKVRAVSSDYQAIYRVSDCGYDYYDWQYDTCEDGSQDGYAGSIGRPIDRIQIVIK